MTRSPRIRLAIVHYHLRRGGVTRVIEHTLNALPADRVQAVVLTGEPSSSRSGRTVQGLGYTGPDARGDASTLADSLEREARNGLGGLPDIWHIHNHALGKNPALPGAVFELARRGARLLLHLHDFAEDGRPGMYRRFRSADGEGPNLYPIADHVHYAVLNDRDLDILGSACGEAARVHFLPNAVAVDTRATAPPPTVRPAPGDPPTRLFLYPTRAIRRKNLGELMLWSAVARPGDRFATTLAPENPEARTIYDAWVAFAREFKLPLDFEVGAAPGRAFEEIVGSADALVTTSVAEGFGLAFLEPWLLGRPLVGRDLPEVTPSLRRAGVNFDGLYESVEVPIDWVGHDRVEAEVASALGQAFTAYGVVPPTDAVSRAMESLVVDDRVDFGRLSEPMQRDIIRRLITDFPGRSALRPARLDEQMADAAAVERNRQAVVAGFGLEEYAKRLMEIYEELLASPSAGRIEYLPPQALIARFLAPERINLLRT